MKKLMLIGVVIMFGATSAFAQKGKEQLPDRAKQFMETNYSAEKIKKVKVDEDRSENKKSYKVKLENGTNIEFDDRGEITEVDGTARVPDKVLPNGIRQYITQNYTNTFVTEFEREDEEIEVELDDGTDLKFDNDGTLKEID